MIDLDAMKREINLSAPIDELRKLHDQANAYLKTMSTEEQQLSLLLIERLVLGDVGHKVTVKFGRNDWSRQRCAVCAVPLEAEGQAVCLISRWENSSVMLCLCDSHARETFEVDIDVLTGALKSRIGRS